MNANPKFLRFAAYSFDRSKAHSEHENVCFISQSRICPSIGVARMTTSITDEDRLLQNSTRPIIAMRKAHRRRRLGLIFGAGVSRAFKFDVPDWKRLLTLAPRHAVTCFTGISQPAFDLKSTDRHRKIWLSWLERILTLT
jgi:hypothetical protein